MGSPTLEEESVRLLDLAEQAVKDGECEAAHHYIEIAREYRALM